MKSTPVVSLRALGTTAVAVTSEPAALVVARAVLVPALRAFDLACSRFRADSELVALSRSAGELVRCGEILTEALSVALRAAEQTHGLVDPTVGRSLRLAGYDRTIGRMQLLGGRLVRPAFAPAGRWREVELDPERRSVRVPCGIELDLGATAKALAADRISRRIADETGSGVLVSLGGDIAIAGPPPGGGWPIKVSDCHSSPPGAPGPTIALADGGLATSSTRVRRWPSSEGSLHHIVDPRTGRPAATPWQTVTVAAASCVEANTASTAAVVLGGDAPNWLESRGLPARLRRADGSIVCVSGWPEEERAAA